MKILIGMVVAALGLTFGAPAFAQDVVCKQSLANLQDVKDGKNPPSGIDENIVRLKPSGDYKAAADEAAFAIDAYREHGDVRHYCPKAKWPAEVKSENLKKALTAAAKANPPVFCGGGQIEASVPHFTRTLFNNAGPLFFQDRADQLQGKLDTTASPWNQEADRHLADAEWMLEIVNDLDAVCPNGQAALDMGSAKISVKTARDFAKDNVDFLACVKARDAWQPQMKAFETAATAGDQAAMNAAYADIVKAAGPVNAACKASEEGTRENAYLVASRRVRILMLSTPGCREAAQNMSVIRGNMNAMGKQSVPQYAADLRTAAKAAGEACKDPSAQTWGEFVAWIGEKNVWRTYDKPKQ